MKKINTLLARFIFFQIILIISCQYVNGYTRLTAPSCNGIFIGGICHYC